MLVELCAYLLHCFAVARARLLAQHISLHASETKQTMNEGSIHARLKVRGLLHVSSLMHHNYMTQTLLPYQYVLITHPF